MLRDYEFNKFLFLGINLIKNLTFEIQWCIFEFSSMKINQSYQKVNFILYEMVLEL